MLTDKKVTDSEIASGVVSLPDKPSEEGIGAEDLKARFDLFPKMIANKFNALIDELLANGLKELGGLNETEITALITQSKEALAQSLAEHSGNKENPHEVTAMQLGVDTAAVVQYKINQAKAEVQGSLNTHVEDKGNPHNVTAEQVGALGEGRIAITLNDVDQTKIPTVKAVNEGISFAGGGDMMKSTYDPRGKARDIFAYADDMAAHFSKSAYNQSKDYADGLYADAAKQTSVDALQGNVNTLQENVDSLETEFGELETELKNSVGDGKTLVANAITAKGVSTATDTTFETMAANIAKIATGKKVVVSTATSSNYGYRLPGTTTDEKGFEVSKLGFKPRYVFVWRTTYESLEVGADAPRNWIITESYAFEGATVDDAGYLTKITSNGFGVYTDDNGQQYRYVAVE